jgi:hypothetical protein
MAESTDTRTHFVVPVQITVKVENADEAVSLVSAIMAQVVNIKGVSVANPPVVGIAAAKDYATLTSAEQDAFAALAADAEAEAEGDETPED